MADTWDSIDRYMIISADTHAGAEIHEYKGYLESRWHEEFDAWVAAYSSPYDDLIDATAARNWDSDLRLSELEADGISAEVTFPNTIPPFFDTIHNFASLPWTQEDFERRAAGLRAHNRWLVDFCGKAPGQRRGLVQIMPHDIDLAIAEARLAKESGVIGGVLAPAIPPNHAVEPWFHTRYEPLWSALEDLELPFGQHPGTGGPDVGKDQPAAPAVMYFEFTHWTRRTLAHLILAGVFERHPNLKAVWTEQGIAWVMQDLMLLDFQVSGMKTDREQDRTTPLFTDDTIRSLSLKPSEYFARNCYLGASFMSRPEVKFRDAIGLDKLMWGADFPHEEGTSPYSREALRSTFYDIPEKECRAMLAGTAASVYGFDLDALVPVAQRVGPLVEEIHTRLDTVPRSNSPAFIGSTAGR
jgi:predicted TIM-barrel fold metal-dependent hydrolase